MYIKSGSVYPNIGLYTYKKGDVMSSPITRLHANAAIEHILKTNSFSDELLRTIIHYGSKLQTSRETHTEYSFHFKSSGERDEIVEGAVGVRKDRVGHYRLWKSAEGLLVFQKSDQPGVTMNTSFNEEDPEYNLGYDPETLETRYFAILRHTLVFRINFGVIIEIQRPYLEPICGTPPLLTGHGIMVHWPWHR